jgi:hypothetical protein
MKKLLTLLLIVLPMAAFAAEDKPATPPAVSPEVQQSKEENAKLRLENAQLRSAIADLRAAYFSLESSRAEMGVALARQEQQQTQQVITDLQAKDKIRKSDVSDSRK